MQLVKVVWQDITTCSGWHSRETADSLDYGGLVKQVGYVVKRDEHFILLTDSLVPLFGETQLGTLTRIPVGCVVSITSLHEPGECPACTRK